MERLNYFEKLTNDNDLPLVHGSKKRNKCEPDESDQAKKDDREAEEDESAELLDPESTKSPTEIDLVAYNAFQKRMLGFYMKFVLLVNGTICAVLHAQWASHVIKNFLTVFPFSVFCGFSGMFVYIILIYRWWHRMPKHMKMGVALFCAIVFCVVAVMELYYLNTHSFSSDGSLYELEYISENKPIKRYNKHVSEGVITTVAFLSFAEAALCVIDAFFLIQ